MPRDAHLVPIELDATRWPREIFDHISLRVKERKLTMKDLGQIKTWTYARPHARPDEDWYKVFSNFTLVGHGQFPTSVLTNGMHPKGRKLAFQSKLLKPALHVGETVYRSL